MKGAETREAEVALSMKESGAHQDKQNRQTSNKAKEAYHTEGHCNEYVGLCCFRPDSTFFL